MTPRSPQLNAHEATSMVRTVIKHHFDLNPRRIFAQTGGLSNFVFSVDHREGDFVVRLSPEPAGLNVYLKEKWATEKARQIGIPAPNILEVGQDVISHPYMISKRVKGEDATRHLNRSEILKELGALASQINSIKTVGFGDRFDWSEQESTKVASWQDYLTDELKLNDRLTVFEETGMLSKSQLARIRGVFECATRMKFEPVLNHGDLRLKNVVVNKSGKILAIIDWEKSSSNLAPHWELSLALHDLTIDEKDEFLEGYGIRAEQMQRMAPLVKAFNLVNYAREVEKAVKSKETDKVERYRMRLSGALDMYSLE